MLQDGSEHTGAIVSANSVQFYFFTLKLLQINQSDLFDISLLDGITTSVNMNVNKVNMRNLYLLNLSQYHEHINMDPD